MIFIKYVCHTSDTFVLIELLANKYEFIYVVYLFYTNTHEKIMPNMQGTHNSYNNKYVTMICKFSFPCKK